MNPAYAVTNSTNASSSYDAWLENPEPLCGIWKNYDSWTSKKPILNNDPLKSWKSERPTSKVICRCLGAQWDKDVPQGFDDVVEAMTSLFELMTTEGWLDVLYVLTDSRGVDMQPIRMDDDEVNWAPTVYFIIVIVMWNFLFLNLFVGVTIDSFNKIKQKSETGSIFLTGAQKEWVRTQEMLLKINPQGKLSRPADALGGLSFDLVTKWWFDPFIMGCIVVNTASLASDHMGQSEDFEGTMEALNMLLAVIFTLEMVLKLAALRMEYVVAGGLTTANHGQEARRPSPVPSLSLAQRSNRPRVPANAPLPPPNPRHAPPQGTLLTIGTASTDSSWC